MCLCFAGIPVSWNPGGRGISLSRVRAPGHAQIYPPPTAPDWGFDQERHQLKLNSREGFYLAVLFGWYIEYYLIFTLVAYPLAATCPLPRWRSQLFQTHTHTTETGTALFFDYLPCCTPRMS